MSNRYIIYDKWMCEQHVGTKVKCNKQNCCAFKIGKKIYTFHNEQIVLEKYTPLPKNLKIKTITVYELKLYSSTEIFNSTAECLRYVKHLFKRNPVSNYKQFLKDIKITPKMICVIKA